VAAAAYQEAAAQGLEQPEEFEAPQLPEALNLLNLAVHRTTDLLRDRAEADRAYRTLMEQLSGRAEAGDVEAAQDMLWVPAVFGYELQTLADRLAEIDSESPLVLRAKGWLALQRGETERARALFQPRAGSDPFAALGLGRTLMDGSPAQTRQLRSVTHTWPRSIPALLSARQLVSTRQSVEPTRAGNVLRQVMDRYPSKIWRSELRVMPWTRFTARALREEADYLAALPVELTLENVSGLALSLGRGGTLPTQVMLQLRAATEAAALNVPPVVVNLGRQLRLEAGASVTVRSWLGRTEVGALLQQVPMADVLVQGQAVLDPRMSRTGTIASGPLGGRQEMTIRRRGAAATPENLAAWTDALTGADRVVTMQAVARLAQLLGTPPQAEAEDAAPLLDPRQRQDVAAALTDAYAEFDPPLRAWTVLMSPASEQVQEALRTMLDQARRAEDAGIRLAYLSRHVRAADDPVLLASLRGGDPEVRAFAQAVQDGVTAMEEAAGEQQAGEAGGAGAASGTPGTETTK
jgi:hypothetical protein